MKRRPRAAWLQPLLRFGPLLRFLPLIAGAFLALGAAPPTPQGRAPAAPTSPTASATAAAAAEDAVDREERAEALCCARLEREFGKTISPAEREAAAKDGSCCALKDRQLRASYEQAIQEDTSRNKIAGERPANAEKERTFAQAMVQMVFMLAAVCALAYAILGRLLPRLLRIEVPTAQRRIMTVVDRLPVDQRRSIIVLRVADQHYLVGIAEQGISLISRIESEEIEQALATAPAPAPRLGRLTATLTGRSSKES